MINIYVIKRLLNKYRIIITKTILFIYKFIVKIKNIRYNKTQTC